MLFNILNKGNIDFTKIVTGNYKINERVHFLMNLCTL